MAITGDEGWWLAPPGLAVWVPPEVNHGARYSESSSLIHLRFGASLASQLSSRCGLVVVSDLLRELAREAARIGSSAEHVGTLELLGRLMVQQVQRRTDGPHLFVPRGEDRRLRHAIDILCAAPGSNIPFHDLAARVHTSPRTLARLFVAETGMTFGRWREHLRVVCAIDRLARGHPITRTALDLGYQSASSFTTLFTRLLGVPPRRYMQRLHGAPVPVPSDQELARNPGIRSIDDVPLGSLG
jgi:AraC-like DNA-binding protein